MQQKILSLVLLLSFALPGLVSVPASAAKCGDVKTAFNFNCGNNVNSESANIRRNPIYAVLVYFVNFLAAGVGIVVVGGIVWGSIIYIHANGNSGKTQQGITLIVNSFIGLLLFIFMYAIMNYLVPGGLIG